jgi:eukaryotic-like serine/threonine-protein kinase
MTWLREPDAEALPGYKLIKPLGTGGFGEVWMCSAPGGISKAIKFVYGNLNAADGADVRAEQEWKALQRIKDVRHPFVLTIERIDIVEGELAIVMELADKSLHDVFLENQNGGRIGIPREDLVGYLSDAADGLDYLIEHYNLLHLDIKPRNLFVIGGRVKVADFGLVKHLERQSSSGLMGGMSPMYAAPETFTSRVSKQCDQYSLAIVYMELLTGVRPFNGRNIRQLAMQHMAEEPDLRPLPEHDRAAVARALAKDPAKRFPTCSAFIQGLLQAGGVVPPNRTRASISLPEIHVETDAPPTRPAPPVPSAKTPKPVKKAPEKRTSDHVFGPDADEVSGASLHPTLAEKEIGLLRPTLLIGMGGFGRRALRELKHRLLDRVGDLTQVPIFRFLYIDSDPDAGDKAIDGAPDQALYADHVFPTPLQPVGNYRRRILDHLTEWLPREKLFSMPRSLQPMGSRALGRLAFSDNYLRFITRIRRELQVATHPESLAQAMSQTGMSIRENCPRIIILAGAVGGSSGALIDAAISLRRLLAQLHFTSAPISLFLFCGSPHDPATPKQELANLYATLTEINHFNDPAISFSAQYGGPDGPKLVHPGAPFSTVYLLQLENRSPEALSDCTAHLSTYLTQELSSPLGFELEQVRGEPPDPDRTPFRSFGTYSIWFPRGLMLRGAARQMCKRLLEDWQEVGLNVSLAPIQALCDAVLAAPELKADRAGPMIEKAATASEGSPGQALGRFLAQLESEIPVVISRGDASGWAQQALERVHDWVGSKAAGDIGTTFHPSKMSRLLSQAVQDIARDWVARLCGEAMKLMEQPGRRIAAAEEALQRMSAFIGEQGATAHRRAHDLSQRSQQARADVQAALDACLTGPGGFSIFGGRSARLLRNLFDHLATFARHRLTEDLAESVVLFFRRVQAGLDERLRDLSFCRQRLTHLQQMLETPGDPFALGGPAGAMERTPAYPSRAAAGFAAVRGSSTVQIILPYGESEIEGAAARFLHGLEPKHWVKLEEVLQALVLTPLGGLYAVCQKTSDLLRQLAGPLIDQTSAYLGELLPVTDVAEVERATGKGRGSEKLAWQIRDCRRLARPLVVGAEVDQRPYLLVPGSAAGADLGEACKDVMPELKVLRVAGQSSDLTLSVEQGYLRFADVGEMLKNCRDAYKELRRTASTSPHARFDVLEWMPLDV